MTGDDPLEVLKRRKAAKPTGDDPLEKLKASKAKAAPASAPAAESPEPGYLERLSTHVLNAAQGIPGMKAVEALAATGPQSGMMGRPVTRTGAPVPKPLSYQESLDALEGNTNQIGGKTKVAERMLGSVATLPFLPANPAMAGAALGGADQLLDADPIRSTGDVGVRAGKTLLGAGAGAVFGKVADVAPTAIRALTSAKTPGANALEREAAMGSADAKNYGQAKLEATASGGTSPDIQAALADKTIKPFADKVRALEQFRTASDADVLMETYKQMGEYERRVGNTIANATDFLPTKAAQEQHIGLGKSRALTAADPTIPSLRPAAQAHAKAEAGMDALETGVDAGRRFMRNSKTPPKKLETKSPEAILRLVASLPPEERAAAEQGVLGELKDSGGIGLDPSITTLFGLTKGFGAAPFLADAGRVNPLLRATNTKTQRAIDALIRAGLLGANATVPR